VIISKRALATFITLTSFMASTILIFTASPQSFAATSALTMGSSSTYGVLASSAITSAAASNITGTSGGDVGVGGATAPTGTITQSGSQILGGASLTALNDANTAFSDARVSVALPVELGATTLTDGAYSGGTFAINGTLTLDGNHDPASVFIFSTATTLITASSSQVVLINGAQACNVFWQIGSSATLGASSTIVGHLIASASIGTGATTTVDGQLIALTGAVTLGGTSIVNDGCAIPTHTVTFDGNTSNGGSTAVQTTNAATALTTNGYTKSGYTFSGWNTAANGSGSSYADGSTYGFAADLTLYAQWTLIPPIAHTVTFMGNGFDGGSTTPEASTIPMPLTTNGFTRSGYTFTGWNTVANGIAGITYLDGTTYSFAADLTLYAQWTAIPAVAHTVTFLGSGFDGGATTPETNFVPAAFISNGFTRAGYTFTNWNTAINGSGAAYANGTTYSFAADLTLFAQWTLIPPIVYTVTFAGNGFDGGATPPESSTAPTPLTPNGFARTSYTFTNWNTADHGSGLSYINGASYSFASDLTLYAQWTAIVIPPITPIPPPAPQPSPIATKPTVIVPVVAPINGTLHIIKLVENRFGGTMLPINFQIKIRKSNSEYSFISIQGRGGKGVSISLPPGIYDLSEVQAAGYRGFWVGDITPSGRVLIRADENAYITRTNLDIAGYFPQIVLPIPVPTLSNSNPPPTMISPPPLIPNATVNGGTLPTTGSTWPDILAMGLIFIFLSIFVPLLNKHEFETDN